MIQRMVRKASTPNRRRDVAVVAWAAVFTLTVPCVARAAERVLAAGPVQVTVNGWNRGVSVAWNGVPVSVGSNMVVTEPPWSPHYYLGPDGSVVDVATPGELSGGGVRLRLKHRAKDGSFIADDTITTYPNGTVERTLQGQFTREDGEALIQWTAACLNPALIVGRKYEARLKDGTTREGVVPVDPASSDANEAALAKGFTSITFDSRIGPIRISADISPGDMICYDYRKSQWADASRPYFWLGDLGTRFKKGDTLGYRITIQLPSGGDAVQPQSVRRGKVTIHPQGTAQGITLGAPPVVIPRPKQMDARGKYLPLGVFAGPDAQPIQADEHAREVLGIGSGAAPVYDAICGFLGCGAPRPPAQPNSPVNEPAGRPVVRLLEPEDGQRLPEEGYEVDVGDDGIMIRANEARGFLYALQTLRQLKVTLPSPGPSGAGEAAVQHVHVRDWPSLSFRGVHLFTGGQGNDLHRKLLRKVIGGLKMNHVVLEAEYIEWDSHPEIHHPEYGMPKDEVRELLDLCRELQIEVIPLVMSLGHCQWMFETGHHADLAEDPDADWAYCVTNPKTYEFIYEIYQEAIDLFKPKIFHIGHDEFHHRGRVPYRESSKKFTVEELFLMDTLRHHQWFKERGIRLMMWGDMLLGKGEGPDACHAASEKSAKALRAKLPKDIVIADWHYVDAPPDQYVNLDAFAADGFTTVASTWSRPGNIVRFAQAAHDKKALGHLQTTWAGYSLDPSCFQNEIHQYAAYVLAAEAGWNAEDPPDPDAYPFATYFLDRMGMSSLKPGYRSGWTASLGPAFNYSLVATDANGWFGLGPDHDLSAMPGGLTRFKGLTFEVGDSGAPALTAIVLRSKMSRGFDFPSRVELEIGAKAAQLAVLHTTDFPCARGTRLGEYVITYEDGTETKTDLVYGHNVLAHTDPTAVADAPIVWQGRTKAGQPVSLRALIWDNPHPENTIRTFTAQSADAAASLVVIGLTGLDAPAPASEP